MHKCCTFNAFFVGKIALGFMDYYVDYMADQSPEGNRLIMPLGMTIHDMYIRYKELYGEDHLQEAQSYKLYRDNFSHVTYQKVKQKVVNNSTHNWYCYVF